MVFAHAGKNHKVRTRFRGSDFRHSFLGKYACIASQMLLGKCSTAPTMEVQSELGNIISRNIGQPSYRGLSGSIVGKRKRSITQSRNGGFGQVFIGHHNTQLKFGAGCNIAGCNKTIVFIQQLHCHGKSRFRIGFRSHIQGQIFVVVTSGAGIVVEHDVLALHQSDGAAALHGRNAAVRNFCGIEGCKLREGRGLAAVILVSNGAAGVFTIAGTESDVHGSDRYRDFGNRSLSVGCGPHTDGGFAYANGRDGAVIYRHHGGVFRLPVGESHARRGRKGFGLPVFQRNIRNIQIKPLGIVGFTCFSGSYSLAGELRVFIPSRKNCSVLGGGGKGTGSKLGIRRKRAAVQNSTNRFSDSKISAFFFIKWLVAVNNVVHQLQIMLPTGFLTNVRTDRTKTFTEKNHIGVCCTDASSTSKTAQISIFDVIRIQLGIQHKGAIFYSRCICCCFITTSPTHICGRCACDFHMSINHRRSNRTPRRPAGNTTNAYNSCAGIGHSNTAIRSKVIDGPARRTVIFSKHAAYIGGIADCFPNTRGNVSSIYTPRTV